MFIELRRISPNFAEFKPPQNWKLQRSGREFLYFLRPHFGATDDPRFELGFQPKGCKRERGRTGRDQLLERRDSESWAIKDTPRHSQSRESVPALTI